MRRCQHQAARSRAPVGKRYRNWAAPTPQALRPSPPGLWRPTWRAICHLPSVATNVEGHMAHVDVMQTHPGTTEELDKLMFIFNAKGVLRSRGMWTRR